MAQSSFGVAFIIASSWWLGKRSASLMLLSAPQCSLVPISFLLLTQQPPDTSPQIHERRFVHDFLDALVPLPSLGLSHRGSVDDLRDPARTAGHHNDAVREINRLLDRMRNEQHRPRVHARELGQLLLHHHSCLRIELTEWLLPQQYILV